VLRAGQSIEIARSPADVFAYVTDPAKLGTWQDAEAVTQVTPGPVGPGTRFREIHKVMGRRREELTEVVVFEPGRRFEIRVVEGPPVDGRWDFEPSGAGTRLTFTPTVRLRPRLRALQPVVAFLTRLAFVRFHRRLKRALESE
jgi:uncharacterized protein YndB with AHSA1/START domain